MRIKTWVLNKLLKHLFCTVTEEEVLRLKNGKFYVEGIEQTNKDISMLKSGASTIQDLYVWEILIKDMKYLANKQMYEKSKTIDDMIAGKFMLYTIDILEKKIDNLIKIE